VVKHVRFSLQISRSNRFMKINILQNIFRQNCKDFFHQNKIIYASTYVHRLEHRTLLMWDRLVTTGHYEHAVYLKTWTRNGLSPQKTLFFENFIIIRLSEEPVNLFWTTLWFVPENIKLDLAHLSYLQGFVVQFPKNTRSSEIVSNLNFIWPLKSQVFSAF